MTTYPTATLENHTTTAGALHGHAGHTFRFQPIDEFAAQAHNFPACRPRHALPAP